jgi:hydroxyethylthiazole kinase
MVMFEDILKNINNKELLVHCLTNYVTVNDCANIILACGGSPIMADDILEVEEITSICNALVINMGTLNTQLIESMIKAGKKANALCHPVILDPVGVGASKFRTDTAIKLMNEIKFDVIRGNASEIKTISEGHGTTKGVDANSSDTITHKNLHTTVDFAKKLSEKTGAIIVITGAIDIVADRKKAYIIENGHAMMSKITGTGCMLTSIIAAFCGANPKNKLTATAAAVCAMGRAGELAVEKMQKEDGGLSSLKMYLIDYMSKTKEVLCEEGIKVESR